MPRFFPPAAKGGPIAGLLAVVNVVNHVDVVIAGNPLVQHVGMADPHVHFFGGKIYMYSTQDQNLSISNVSCCTGPWWIWSSEDLVHWSQESSFAGFSWAPAQYLHTQHLYWATDATERNGFFYWYVSVGSGSIAVLRASTPTGPWEDPLGHLLFSDADGQRLQPPTGIRDPGVLADDDGRYYIVFGSCSGEKQPDDTCYYAAELHGDMVSYEPPVHLHVQDPVGPYGPGKASDKPFLHKRGDTYYLSWGCFYATASSPYGPYTYRGAFMDVGLIAPPFRMNSTSEPWYTKEDYSDRHGSFLHLHGQWYFFCNDRSHSDALRYNASGFFFRDTVASYVHYFKNGSIAPLVIDAQGVGSHSFSRDPLLPAEHYFSVEGGEKVEASDGGFEVAGLRAGSALTFGNVVGLHPKGSFVLRVSNGGSCIGAVMLELATGSSKAKIATCTIGITGGWHDHSDVHCQPTGAWLEQADCPQTLRLTFTSACAGEELARLDYIYFLAEESKPILI